MVESRLNVPNGLSAFRIACVPILLVLAWHGALAPFLIGFALGLASDVLDGVLARRLGQVTEFGARLDQWGDFALWLSLPLAAWWLWPEGPHVRPTAPVRRSRAVHAGSPSSTRTTTTAKSNPAVDPRILWAVLPGKRTTP